MLFQGALLERGATIMASLGEPCFVFGWREERVEAAEIVAAAMNDAEGAAALMAWAERLEAFEPEAVAASEATPREPRRVAYRGRDGQRVSAALASLARSQLRACV